MLMYILWVQRKLKKSIAAFSIKMTSKMAIFSYSAKDALQLQCFLWISLPGDYRVTDEALLAETT